ncbi:MAG: sugar phosphate isomerase/epimerase family protein [Caulobacteraceae bacterium]
MTDLRSDLVFSMPWAMIQHLPFAEQVRAVKLAGFQEMSLHPFNLGVAIAGGLSLAEMKAMLDGEGIGVNRIDPLAAWTPDWRAHNFGLDFNVTTAADALAVFDLAAYFGAKHISLNAMWHADRYALDELVHHYAAICERAAGYGLTCDIEPIPMWGIPTLEVALEVLKRADVPNAGLIIDTTHLCRGKTPLDVLASVPGELVTAVQICDGHMPQPAHLTLEEECFSRLWSGEGGFPIAEIISILDASGGLNGDGPEVFSPDYVRDGTPAETIAQMARDSMLQFGELTDVARPQ